MPPSAVKTPRDEELWIEAKSAAARAGHPGDYAYIMSIFKKMKGGSLGKSLAFAAAAAGATAARKMSAGGGAAPQKTKVTLGQKLKAAMGKRPKGAGWTPVPGGKHGGYRKWSGSRWQYWYPGMDQPASESKAEAHLAFSKKKKAKEDAEKKVKKLERKGDKAKKRHSRALDAGDSRDRVHRHREQARQHFEEADKLRREHGMPARMARKSLVLRSSNLQKSEQAYELKTGDHFKLDKYPGEVFEALTDGGEGATILAKPVGGRAGSMFNVLNSEPITRAEGTSLVYARGEKMMIGRGFDRQTIRGPIAIPGDHWTLKTADGDWTVKIVSQKFDQYGQWSYQAKFPNGSIGEVLQSSLKDRKTKAPNRPSGAGWQPIPGGKRGGFRRRKAGRYEYWYPDTKKSLRKAVSTAKPPPGFTPIKGSTKGGYHMKRGTRYIYWYPGQGITSKPHADDHGKAPGSKPASGKPPAGKHELDHGKDGRPETIRDPSKLPEGFNNMPKAQRASMTAHYDHVTEGMNERFGEATSYKGDIKKAIGAHVDELVSQGHIIPGNADRAKKMFNDQYDAGIKAGLNKQLLAEAMHENVRKVAHQEVEASRRTLGDHGVRHLAVNCEQASKVFDALEAGGGSVTPVQRFMAFQVMVDHDMGYTIPAIAQGGFAVKDDYHPQASTVMSFQQRDKLEKLFGGSEHFDQYVRGVANHSGSEVDWEKDPFGSAIRLADNTHLFADKMPEVLFDSTAAVEAMVKIKMATNLIPPTVKEEVVDEDGNKEIKMKRTPEDKAKFKKLVAGIKNTLVSEIRKREDLPDSTRQNLIKAAGEIGELTPKFLISRLAGRSPNFEFKGGTMNCVIEQSEARNTIGEVFGDDEEDKQFAKLLKDYGTKPDTVLGTKPPPPKAKIGENGTLEFTWQPPKDADPAERRHAETMSKYKTEFDTIKGLADGKAKDDAMAKFFGTEGSMKKSARIGSVDHGLDHDAQIAEMLEKGGLGVDGTLRHTSKGATGLRKSVETLGGSIHQGELITPGTGAQSSPSHHADDREAYMRAQTAAQTRDFDGAGNQGCGGLREWFEGSYDLNDPDIAMRTNVPLAYTGIAKSGPPPTQVIDTDDPRLRAIHRTPTPDGGARSAIDFVYKRDADR